MMKFIITEAHTCPSFLPRAAGDAKLSTAAMHAAIHDSGIPVSEYIRREYFYTAFTEFSAAIGNEPALLAEEVKRAMRKFDYLFGTIYDKSESDLEKDARFTQGDYRRFCALFFAFVRHHLQCCVLMVQRERKKRIQPRHIMCALVISGIIP